MTKYYLKGIDINLNNVNLEDINSIQFIIDNETYFFKY